jgi:hypothetical protein
MGGARDCQGCNGLLSIGEKRQMLGDMGAILRNGGFGGARPIFPPRLEFTFYEIALAAAQYRDSHIQTLGGGWYCYSALPWLFTYRTPEWTEQEVKAHTARIHKLLW